ncbi:unnamed protein product [Prunus armeniaca]
MQGNKLVRRSYSGPHLTCIKYPQTFEVLCKIHDGECGNNFGGRSLSQKALNIGYFWPTMCHDSTEYVKKCDRGQRYKLIPNMPAEVYHPQNSPWPFMQWAIDLVGPFPPAPAKKEMMIVATDYFTKLIEAEALSSIKEANMERFIWRNIICWQVTAKQSPIRSVLRETQDDDQKRPLGDAGCARNFLREGGKIVIQLPISSVIRETRGDDQKRPSGDSTRRQDSHTIAHKQRHSGDAGRRPNHPKGCAEHARSPLRGALALANFLRGAILRDMQNTPGVLQGGP